MTLAALVATAFLLFFLREWLQELVDRARKREAMIEADFVRDCCCRKTKVERIDVGRYRVTLLKE